MAFILQIYKETRKSPAAWEFYHWAWSWYESRFTACTRKGITAVALRAAMPSQPYWPACSDVQSSDLEFTCRKTSVGGWEA